MVCTTSDNMLDFFLSLILAVQLDRQKVQTFKPKTINCSVKYNREGWNSPNINEVKLFTLQK